MIDVESRNRRKIRATKTAHYLGIILHVRWWATKYGQAVTNYIAKTSRALLVNLSTEGINVKILCLSFTAGLPKNPKRQLTLNDGLVFILERF